MLDTLIKEDFLRILDTFVDGVLIIDEDRNIIYCNSALCKLYNMTKVELIDKDCYFPVEKGCVDYSFAEMVFNTKKVITYEQRNKKGKRFISTASPVCDLAGNPIFVLEQIRSLDALEFYAPEFVEKALPESDLEKNNTVKKDREHTIAEFKSKAMQNVYRLADSMATKNINIFILGNSGTGKSQLAKRIHENSARKSGPLVTINCAAIPATLIESELFGYVKGAFSGASNKGKQGLVEVANGGTLFLDEIGELPLPLQSKLLQFVQEKTYIPVGGVQPMQVDTRIIAATNRDIPELINQGIFREDLYYRLATVTLVIPPLNQRPDDVRMLLNHFCNEFSLRHETEVWLSKEAMNALCCYEWPGNIREMEHLVEFLILSCQTGYITLDMLPSNINKKVLEEKTAEIGKNPMCIVEEEQEKTSEKDFSEVESLDSYINFHEKNLVKALYPKFNTSYKLSERLKISQSTANRLIRKHIKEK